MIFTTQKIISKVGIMRATVYHAPGDVRVENVPDPVIKKPTDAIVRITHACNGLTKSNLSLS